MSTTAPTVPTRGRQERGAQDRSLGSSVSTKQIAWAAANGRLVDFQTTVGQQRGYVIGQDDFHWIIASPTDDGHVVRLVHKGSAPVVTITSTTIEQEPEASKASITLAGGAFWAYCRKSNPTL